ncbi:MAG: ATP-binding cassette domain-containing protein [Pseudomonadota bacterium]
MTALFSLKDVGFEVSGKSLLRNLSLDLPQGKLIGLIGQNGSGKSTLLRLLAGQANPSAGHVVFDGTKLPDWPRKVLAQRLAYLPQTLPASDGMMVRELVTLGRYPWHGPLGRPGPADQEAVNRALSLCDLSDMADRIVTALSGGERQRCWIAMLICQNAKCLLLDEATSALDVAYQRDILALLNKLCREHAVSVCIVLHDLNGAARYCSHIIALNNGEICFQGDVADLMNTSTLRAIYGSDMEILERRDGSSAALVL